MSSLGNLEVRVGETMSFTLQQWAGRHRFPPLFSQTSRTDPSLVHERAPLAAPKAASLLFLPCRFLLGRKEGGKGRKGGCGRPLSCRAPRRDRQCETPLSLIGLVLRSRPSPSPPAPPSHSLCADRAVFAAARNIIIIILVVGVIVIVVSVVIVVVIHNKTE